MTWATSVQILGLSVLDYRPDVPVRERQTSDAHHRIMPLPRGGSISTTYVNTLLQSRTRAGSGVVRMDPLRFLAGCRTRRLNQA